MGNSAQQHRVATGCYAGHLATKSWISSPKYWSRLKRERRKSDADLAVLQVEIENWWMVTILVMMNVIISVIRSILTVLVISILMLWGVESMFIVH